MATLHTGLRRLSRLFAPGSTSKLTGDATLAAAASVYLNFLSLTRNVDEELAAARYLQFQDLRAADPAALRRAGLRRHEVVPTRDISAAWASDLLRPTDMAVSRDDERSRAAKYRVPAWYAHAQHRLLQSGAAFEAKTGTRFQVVNNLGSITKSAATGAAVGGVLASPLNAAAGAAAGAVLGGVHGARREDRGVAATVATASFDADRSGIITAAERKAALAPWMARYDATAALWRKQTGTRYRLPNKANLKPPPAAAAGADDQQGGQAAPRDWPVQALRRKETPGTRDRFPNLKAGTDQDGAVQRALQLPLPGGDDGAAAQKAAQLVAGMRSQDKFASRILALGPALVDPAWVERAVARYGQFLLLARDNPGQVVVPTLDIDLVWHAHMLSPDDYADDCRAVVGRVLAHDTGHGQDTLEDAFARTQALWRDATGEPMVAPQPSKKDKLQKREDRGGGGGVACGSCGFHLPHGSLPHQAAEQAQVEALEPAERELQWADESIDADNWDTSSPSVMGGADDVWEATEDVASPDGDSAKGWGSNDPWASSGSDDGGGGGCSSCGGGCGS